MSDELESIRAHLGALYDFAPPPVAPFLCTEDEARAAVGDAVERGEVLLVHEDEGEIAIGLYVSDAAIEAFRRGEAHGWQLATEGVSHFAYLYFRADNAESVTQLELELQAEVDKYATGLLQDEADLRGFGAALIQRRDKRVRRSRELRALLFADPQFLDAPDTEAGERYRLANRAAARYARDLEQRFVARGDELGLLRELRRFYRLGQHAMLARALG